MPVSHSLQKTIVRLYVKDKLSMMQISSRVGVSPSTVRYNLDKQNIIRRSISDAITSVYRTKFKKKPFKVKIAHTIADKELKVAGVMLYWAEGARGGNVVKFTNSDPEMIKIFLTFLREICGISKERLKAIIHTYTDQDQKLIEDFWSSVTDIPRSNFYKTHVHQGKPGTYKNKSAYGTIALNYADTRLLKLILQWINDYKAKFVKSLPT